MSSWALNANNCFRLNCDEIKRIDSTKHKAFRFANQDKSKKNFRAVHKI
jgi:hypothetical protein